MRRDKSEANSGLTQTHYHCAGEHSGIEDIEMGHDRE